jgi:ABC-type Mn2+/Zn2+ transport system permease subunit
MRRLPAIMATSIATALLATVVGLYLSFYLDLPSGPSIVMIATGLFLLALGVSRFNQSTRQPASASPPLG